MKKLLVLFLFLSLTLSAQRDKHPDTIYCLTMGNMVVFVNTDSWVGSVSLISTEYTFTNKKPDFVYLDFGDSDWIWSHSREIVNGDEALLVYTSDIIDEKTIKKRKGRVYVTYGNFNYTFYKSEKPNDKKLQRNLHKYLKNYNRRERKKKNL